MIEFWTGLIGPDHTLFSELQLLCTQLGVVCRRSGIVLAATGAGLALAAHVGIAEVEVFSTFPPTSSPPASPPRYAPPSTPDS